MKYHSSSFWLPLMVEDEGAVEQALRGLAVDHDEVVEDHEACSGGGQLDPWVVVRREKLQVRDPVALLVRGRRPGCSRRAGGGAAPSRRPRSPRMLSLNCTTAAGVIRAPNHLQGLRLVDVAPDRAGALLVEAWPPVVESAYRSRRRCRRAASRAGPPPCTQATRRWVMTTRARRFRLRSTSTQQEGDEATA